MVRKLQVPKTLVRILEKIKLKYPSTKIKIQLIMEKHFSHQQLNFTNKGNFISENEPSVMIPQFLQSFLTGHMGHDHHKNDGRVEGL